MSEQLQPVKVKSIVMNAGTQMRAWMNTDVIAEYAALMKEGIEFDPVEIVLVDDQLILVNGFHRINAAIKAGLETFNALITVGTMEDATWAASAANKKNALKRNSSDLQRAIEAALLHPRGAALSDRQIAEHVGCTHPTVGSARTKLVATGKLTSGDTRTGKDGRQINTANIGSKHQMEQWHELVFKPWVKSAGKADLHLIHKDGEYLHIQIEDIHSNTITQRYHRSYGYFSPHGVQKSGYVACFDRSYVELFEEDGLKIYIEEFGDLPELMQRVAKATLNKRGYGHETYTFVRVDPQLQPGNRVAKITQRTSWGESYATIAEVIGVSKSFIHARRFGSKQDEIWYGDQIAPLETAYQIARSPTILRHGEWRSDIDLNWVKEYAGLKEFYAPEALLFAHSNDAFIALGDDAQLAAANISGISAQDDQFGAVFVTFDETALNTFAARSPVVIYPIDRPTVRNFWQNVVAAQAQPAAAPTQPVLPPKQAAIDGKMAASANGDPRGAALWEFWYTLLRIEEIIDELNIQDDDDPLAETIIPLLNLKHVVGKQIGIDVAETESLS